MPWLLDTNVLSELRKPKPRPQVLAFIAGCPLPQLEQGRKTGHTYSQPDLMIAASALEHDLTVVTRDPSHYERAGVRVVNPWQTK